MAFPGSEPKQRLNLSKLATEVMHYDQFTFGVEGRSEFLNRIFEHYAPEADASISRSLNIYRGKLEESLSTILGDESTKRRIITKLAEEKEDELKNRTDSYEKGESFTFYLYKHNFTYLTEPDSECCEERYYKRRGDYIKSVIEEYARLPYVHREKVYFKPYIEQIKHAIEKKWQLRVDTDQYITYSVYPYKILCDPLSTHNYLIGYCQRYDHAEDEKYPVTFRISALQSVKPEKSKSAFLTKSEKEKLIQSITSRGVQFMSSGEEEVRVRLSTTGQSKFRRQIHLRPAQVGEPEGDEYVFRCTKTQAEFYFFKFGENAEILQPEDLRQRMATMYENAAEMYQGQRRCVLP